MYPVLWGVATLIRGPLIGWYPYYFLDPRQVSGPPEFVISCAVALASFSIVATALVLISRMPLPRRLRTDADPGPTILDDDRGSPAGAVDARERVGASAQT